jgi:hypothetical protein
MGIARLNKNNECKKTDPTVEPAYSRRTKGMSISDSGKQGESVLRRHIVLLHALLHEQQILLLPQMEIRNVNNTPSRRL